VNALEEPTSGSHKLRNAMTLRWITSAAPVQDTNGKSGVHAMQLVVEVPGPVLESVKDISVPISSVTITRQ